MMKKIFALLLMIMMFCQVCGAFEQPDPSRWQKLKAYDDGSTYWIDARSLRFEKRFSDNYANSWILKHNSNDDSSTQFNLEINMNKREFRFLSVYLYKPDGKLEASSSTPTPSQGIIPGTLIESIYDILHIIYSDVDKNPSDYPNSIVSGLNK